MMGERQPAARNRERVLLFAIVLQCLSGVRGFSGAVPYMSSLEDQIRDKSLTGLVQKALHARKSFFEEMKTENTNCFRVYHGATEGTEGLTIDRYGETLLFQTFREPHFLSEGSVEVLSEIEQLVNAELDSDLRVILSHRGKGSKESPREKAYRQLQFEIDGEKPRLEKGMTGTENGVVFDVSPRPGKDPWLYLDFRAGRRWLREHAEGKRVLNAFSYSCTAGVCAALGGAASVWNLDFSPGALEIGEKNAALSQIEVVKAAPGVKGAAAGFSLVKADALPSLRQMAKLPAGGRFGRGGRRATKKPEAKFPSHMVLSKRMVPDYFVARQFDIVVLDPPTFASSPFGAVDIVRDYQSLLKPAVLATAPGGTVLATNHVSTIDMDAFLQTCSRCCAKAGRPLVREPEVLVPDVDFPAREDGRHPLKMALLHV